jgi:hypothetical protein
MHYNWKRIPVLSRKRFSVHEKSVESFHGVDEYTAMIVKLGFYDFPWGDSPVFPTPLNDSTRLDLKKMTCRVAL